MSTIGSRIKQARENKGLLQSQLAKQIEVKSANVISNWEKDVSKPDANKMVRLCEALGVSASYLLDYSGGTDFTVKPHEIDHLEKYRTLDDHGKKLTDMILNEEYARCITSRIEPAPLPETVEEEHDPYYNVIPFRNSEQPVSAGTGVYLGPESFDSLMVRENELTSRGSFGVPVSGDSMVPHYHDGDILIVEKCEELELGEIGVFTLNGEGYVKQLGHGELISLNPKYKPIPMNESILLNGRVIGILDPEWIKG